MRSNSIAVVGSISILLSGCASNLFDNAPIAIPVYVAVSAADLSSCDSIRLGGNIIKFATDTAYLSLSHYDLKANGYTKTTLDSSEVAAETSSSPSYLYVKRPGTYAFSMYALHTYNWKLDTLCSKTGTTSTTNLSGVFTSAHPVAVLTLTSSSQKVAISLKEYPGISDPNLLNLP